MRPHEDRPSIVYKATNGVNANIYVGVTSRSLEARRRGHIADAKSKRPGCRVLNAAIRKYGEDAFTWEVLKSFGTFAEALAGEIRFIEQLKPAYNITGGGEGFRGMARTPEWRRKISLANKGRKASPETIANMRAARLAADSGKPVICLNDGQVFRSAKRAAEYYSVSKKQIGEICCGRETATKGLHFQFYHAPLSAAECAEIVARRELHKKKNLSILGESRKRPVTCLSDGMTHESGVAAARYYRIAQMRVVQLCQSGTATRAGLRFMYADTESPVVPYVRTAAEVAAFRERQEAGRRKAVEAQSKLVSCVDCDVVYSSVSDAARAHSTHVSNVSAAIHRGGKSKGHKFSFSEVAP